MFGEKSHKTSTSLDSYFTQPNNLVDLFEDSVARHQDKYLFGTKNKSANQYEWVTYRDVAERVNNLRDALKQLGLSKGDKVGIIAGNSTEWFVCVAATHGLGGIFVPMYEKELQKIWQYIIRDSGLKYLFVSNQVVYDIVKRFQKDMPDLEKIFILEGESENSLASLEKMGKSNSIPSHKPHWSDTAYIIYTSGTTGDPKGVMLHHGNITQCARQCSISFDSGVHEVGLGILPWAHSYGLTCDLYTFMMGGWQFAFAESADKLLINFSEIKPTCMNAVPRVLNIVYEKIQTGLAADPVKKQFFEAACAEAVKNRGLVEKTKEFKDYDTLVFSQVRNIFGGRLKQVIAGGAMMKPEIAMFFDDVGIIIYIGYGLTETSPAIANNSPNRGNRYGSVGKPFDNTKVIIDKSRVGEDSMDGEIIVYGPLVMQGYLNKPEATREAFVPDTWNGFTGIRTGDRGWLDEDGYLYITGRFKDEYKLENGKYVHPESIEGEIRIIPFVANAFLYGEGHLYNVALIVPNFDVLKTDPLTAAWAQGTPGEIIAKKECTDFISQVITEYLQKTIGGYEMPKKFLFVAEDFSVENGMMTQTMKLVRRNVMEQYGEKLKALYND